MSLLNEFILLFFFFLSFHIFKENDNINMNIECLLTFLTNFNNNINIKI